jgi:hypothetical protein
MLRRKISIIFFWLLPKELSLLRMPLAHIGEARAKKIGVGGKKFKLLLKAFSLVALRVRSIVCALRKLKLISKHYAVCAWMFINISGFKIPAGLEFPFNGIIDSSGFLKGGELLIDIQHSRRSSALNLISRT